MDLVVLVVTVYDTKVNALNGAAKYDFNTICTGSLYKNRKDTKDAMKGYAG